MAPYSSPENIIPSATKVLIQHGSPLTQESDPHVFAYYTDRMIEYPSERISDERFESSAQNIGRSAEHYAVKNDHHGQTKALAQVSLLNESSMLMPQIDGGHYGFEHPVRQAGSFSIDMSTYHPHDTDTNPQNHTANLSIYLEVLGSIYDNGRATLDQFIARGCCSDDECSIEFIRTKQMRAIGMLGLRGVFEQNLHSKGVVFSCIEEPCVLDNNQTAHIGAFLHTVFNNDSEIFE